MDASEFLLEYLKEQYTQARQHETRQTATTTFLTAAAAAILGLAINQGSLVQRNWWIGIVVAMIGLANLGIIGAHQLGNRYHTNLAGKVRRAIEDNIIDWGRAKSASALRREALEDLKLSGPDVGIGRLVYRRLKLIPILVSCVGFAVALAAALFGTGSS